MLFFKIFLDFCYSLIFLLFILSAPVIAFVPSMFNLVDISGPFIVIKPAETPKKVGIILTCQNSNGLDERTSMRPH